MQMKATSIADRHPLSQAPLPLHSPAFPRFPRQSLNSTVPPSKARYVNRMSAAAFKPNRPYSSVIGDELRQPVLTGDMGGES